MKRSVSVSRIVSHPSTLAVFSGLLGAFIGFLLNLAAGGKTSQLIWIALIFAMLFSLSLTAWQMYTQEQTGEQWMTMLQEMVFQTYFLTLVAPKPEISQLAQQRLESRSRNQEP
jgi:ABC-type amino acid transport system permease subunit